MNILSGWKTYILVALFVACVVCEKFLGMDIPGFVVGDDWLETIMVALGLGTLRAGVKAEVGKVAGK